MYVEHTADCVEVCKHKASQHVSIGIGDNLVLSQLGPDGHGSWLMK